MRAVALAALLVGCSDPRDCSLDSVELDYIGDTPLDNCGNPSDGPPAPDTSAYQTAQACVVDHAQQHRAFIVTWTDQGVDTIQREAYVGMTRDGTWTLAAFGQWQGIRGTSPAERDSCTDVIAQPSFCDTWRRDLCLQCVGEKVVDQCEP